MTDVTGVFEGGGVKGIALAGGAAAAMEAGYRFSSAVGTSAGAIVASLVIAGYGSRELEEIVVEMDWPKLMDRRMVSRLPMLGPHLAMLLGQGLARGARLEQEITRLLAARGVHRFGDLPHGSLRVVATDLSHGQGVVFPDALTEYGIDPTSFSIARAVRASVAVPFVFEPVSIRNRIDGEVSVLADGGLAAKFPVQVVPLGDPMLGFRLKPNGEDHAHREINGPVTLAAAVMVAGMTARESLPVLCREIGNTVEIPVDHPALDFDLTPSRAASMFHAAKNSAADSLRQMSTAH